MFDLAQQLKNLPEAPGVYLMHDAQDRIIYVGKAKVIKNRVRQYFQSAKNHGAKVRAMVSHIAWFEYIITDSELEALVLECTLIKKHKPHYNILLKDDKHFPYIKVSMQDDYPRLTVTRKMTDDGARYFGPYTGMEIVRHMLDIVGRIFLIPTCARRFPADIGKGRPCLNYQINKCFAPCRGNTSREEYREVFAGICSFLEGRHDALIANLTAQMETASKDLAFERAASLRDKIISIRAVTQRQKVVSDSGADQDIVAFACYDGKAFVEIFFVRSGRVTGRQNFCIDDAEGLEDAEIMDGFLKQYYASAVFVPRELVLSCETEDKAVLNQYLSERLGRKVTITVPKRGEKKNIIKMVEKNAWQAVEDYKLKKLKKEADTGALQKLAACLQFGSVPNRIEAYDISNISGTSNVGAMVVFEGGVPAKSEYRKFRINSVAGQDDYASMSEMLCRRFTHAQREQQEIREGKLAPGKAKFTKLPDLVLLDGGKGHVSAARRTLDALGISLPLFGMVKDEKHKFRALVDEESQFTLPKNSAAYTLVGNISEQVHKTAVAYHINLRGRKGISSELANIDGIGDVRRKLLMRRFKSVGAIAAASIQQLVAAGLDKRSAANVYAYFHRQGSETQP